MKTSHVFVWEIGIFRHNFLTEGWKSVVMNSTVLVAQETALEAPERKIWDKFSIVLGWCLQEFGTVYMHWHAKNNVLDPVLQQFYLSSSSSFLHGRNNLHEDEAFPCLSTEHARTRFPPPLKELAEWRRRQQRTSQICSSYKQKKTVSACATRPGRALFIFVYGFHTYSHTGSMEQHK